MRRYPTATATACFALIALVLTGPALLGRSALGAHCVLDWDPLYRTGPPPPLPTMGDQSLILLDFPRDSRVARGLHEGRLDLWNPLSGCGAPLWAEQGGPFFPLKLPFYVAPSQTTYTLFLALRLVIAALGAYLLARHRGLALVPAIAAGATFELSGVVVAQTQFGAASATYLLPWVILGSYAIAEKRTVAAVVGAGIALGVAGNSGHPGLILIVFAAFGAAVLGHMLASWRQPQAAAAIALCAGLSMALGLALAAPSLLPLAELSTLAESYKGRGKGVAVRTALLIQSRFNLATALFPSGFLRSGAQLPDAYNFVSTIGVLTLVAAVAGVLRRRLDTALLCVAVLGVVLATEPPGLTWLYDLRPVRLIIPTYAWPLVLLALTQSAGAGVQILTGVRGWRTGLPSLVLYIAGAFFTLFALSKIDVRTMGAAGAMVNTGAIDYLRSGLAGGASVAPLIWPFALASIVYGICFAVQRTRVARVAAAGLTALMAIEQLMTFGPFFVQPASAALATPPSRAVRFLQGRLADGDARMLALPHRVGHPLTPMLFGLPDLRGLSALAIGRYYNYLRAISRDAGEFTIQHVPVTKSPLLDLAAVRYIVLPNPGIIATSELGAKRLTVAIPPGKHDSTMPLVYRDESVLVYENRAALPRVRIVHENERVPDEAAARRWLTAIGRRSEHAGEIGLAHTVVLEPDEHGREAPDVSAFGSPRETVRVVDQSDPDRLVIDVRLDDPGFVVIADTYYPGWKASVDGKPTSIYPANFLFRAVFVPAGAHTVVLSYEPVPFRGGRLIFVVAALTCVLCLVRGRHRSWPLLTPRRHLGQDEPVQPSIDRRSRFAGWSGAGIAVLWATVVALHLVYLRPGGPWLHQPDPLTLLRDEGTTLYDSYRIVLGETMYRDFFEFQGPVYFHLIAALFATTGPSVTAARLLTLVVTGLSAVLLGIIVRRFCGRVAGVSAAVIHAVIFFPVWPVAYAHWVAEAAVLGALVLLARDGESRPRADLAAGALLGTAALTIQSLGLPSLVAAVGLTSLPRIATRHWWSAARRAATVTAGALLPMGAALLYFASVGALDDLFYSLWVWPRDHYLQGRGGATPFGSGLDLFLNRHQGVPEPWRSLTEVALRSIVTLPLVMAAGTVVVVPVIVARLWKGSRDYAFALAFGVSLAALAPLMTNRVWSDVTHIAFADSFALIGIAAVFSLIPRHWRLAGWAPACAFAALAAIGTANYGYKLAATWVPSTHMKDWRTQALKLPGAEHFDETTDKDARIVVGVNGGFYYLYVRRAAIGFTYLPVPPAGTETYLSDTQWRELAANIVERQPTAMHLTDEQWAAVVSREPKLPEMYVHDLANKLFRLRTVRNEVTHEGTTQVSLPFAFERYADNPIMRVEPGWQNMWVHPYSVLQVANEVWMWYGGGENSTPVDIGLAVSDDGLSWRRHPGNPIVSPDPRGWDRSTVQHWTVLRKDEGFAALYAAETNPDRRFRIGYAESEDGITWARASQPVLEPGTRWSWDRHFTIPSAVIRKGDEYWMYYWGGTGAFATESWKVGLAISTDLKHWRKHPHNPIFQGRRSSWELGILDVDVVQIGDTYYMLYQGNSHPDADLSRLGLAASKDGVRWVRLGLEPFFGNGALGSWDADWTEGPQLLHLDGRWLLYYMGAGAPEQRKMQIGGAISAAEGTVLPLSGG